MSADGVRIDIWLWAIRTYRSRTMATNACTSGKVSVNGVTAKASRQVRVGDTVAAFAGGRERVFEVAELPTKRLGAALAVQAYIDHSPPPPPKEKRPEDVAVRDPGAGRPTKRDRRQMDRWRGRDLQ